MASIRSTMLPLGTPAARFNLFNPRDQKDYSLDELKSHKATVLMFLCNHCPYVIHVRDRLIKLVKDYLSSGISFIAINSNDKEKYPQDGPDMMKELAEKLNFPFPYLFDETQNVAKVYQAACTPDFYIFDENMKLVYRGQLDDSRPGNNIPVSGFDLRNALDNLISGVPVNKNQKPSIGCNIKWK